MRHEHEKPIDESMTMNGEPRITMPSIASFGPINEKEGTFSNEYIVSDDGQTLLWYAQKRNGRTNGPLVSHNTEENRKALEEAGYTRGHWAGINVESRTTQVTREALADWLKRTSI